MKHVREFVCQAFLILVVGIIQFFTMPGLYYPGDNYGSRIEAAAIMESGEMGIPYADKAALLTFVEESGQYFFENDDKRRYYSKYGLFQSLVYIPPLMVEHWLLGTGNNNKKRFLFLLNLYNILFAVLAVYYFYNSAQLFTKRHWVAALFVFLSLYTTYLWYYIRSPAHEIYYIFPGLAFIYHYLAYLKTGQARKHLFFAICFLGVLFLIKPFYAVLLVPAWLFPFCLHPGGDPFVKRFLHNLRPGNVKKYIWCLMLPTAVFLAVLFTTNNMRYGSLFSFGYDQWVNTSGVRPGVFSIEQPHTALFNFLIKPGNANVLQHYPVLLLALFAWPLFYKKHKQAALFLGSCGGLLFIVVCFFRSWSGEWCYGPRLILLSAVILSLPAVMVLERLIVNCRVKKWLLLPLVAAIGVLGFSFKMQVNINSLNYHSFYYLQTIVLQSQDPNIEREIRRFHRGIVMKDLIEYCRGEKKPRLYMLMEQRVPPQKLPHLKAALQEIGQPNYFFIEKNSTPETQ